MRITIDLSETESRSATIHSGHIGATAVDTRAADTPAIDGGAAPVSLLMTLGAPSVDEGAGSLDRISADPMAINASGPPEWLAGVIEGGGRHRRG